MKLDMNTVGIVITILLAIYGALKAIAPKTQTTADDRLVERLEAAKEWAERLAPHVWAVVEVLAASGAINKDSLSKAEEFAKRMETAQKSPETVAATIAAGLSAADKLGRLDPPAGPVSQ